MDALAMVWLWSMYGPWSVVQKQIMDDGPQTTDDLAMVHGLWSIVQKQTIDDGPRTMDDLAMVYGLSSKCLINHARTSSRIDGTNS